MAISMGNPHSAERLAFQALDWIRRGRRSSFGHSPWIECPSGPLYVKGMIPKHFMQMLTLNKLHVLEARAGQFAEIRSAMLVLRKAISLLNEAWGRLIRTPHLASGYIVIAEKTPS